MLEVSQSPSQGKRVGGETPAWCPTRICPSQRPVNLPIALAGRNPPPPSLQLAAPLLAAPITRFGEHMKQGNFVVDLRSIIRMQDPLTIEQLRQMKRDLEEMKVRADEMTALLGTGFGTKDQRARRAQELSGAIQRLQWAFDRGEKASGAG